MVLKALCLSKTFFIYNQNAWDLLILTNIVLCTVYKFYKLQNLSYFISY